MKIPDVVMWLEFLLDPASDKSQPNEALEHAILLCQAFEWVQEHNAIVVLNGEQCRVGVGDFWYTAKTLPKAVEKAKLRVHALG